MNGAAQPKTVRVELGERGYDIVIGNGLVASAGAHIKPLLAQPRVVTITDENVAGHWLEPYRASLAAAGIEGAELILPPGEQTKDFQHLQQVSEWLLETGIDRKTMLVALGGGVIGDLAGFAAAIALRGIPFVQVPTTLLSQVDSSVGGKTPSTRRRAKTWSAPSTSRSWCSPTWTPSIPCPAAR